MREGALFAFGMLAWFAYHWANQGSFEARTEGSALVTTALMGLLAVCAWTDHLKRREPKPPK